MAENPLLPHRKLKELHALMLRCRDLQRKQRTGGPAREALLAATSIHLQPGDLLFPEPNDLVAAHLAPAPRTKRKTPPPQAPPPRALPRLAVATAAAKGLQAAQVDALILAFATAGAAEPAWAAALEYAQANQLPFLLAVTDATTTSRRPAAGALTYKNIQPVAARLKLPVLPVDGEDAVALFRVMQESAFHARIGGGPAVIWAHVTAGKLTAAQQPLARLKAYLNIRGIKV